MRSLRARVVFPVDAPPIEHGVVTVEGTKIVAVGVSMPADSELQDLGQVALLPGLINTHTHLEFSALQKPIGQPGMRLVDWIRLILANRGQRLDSALVASAIRAGCRESLLHGTTAIGEIATEASDLYRTDEPQPLLTRFTEVIGFSNARAASALVAVLERLDQNCKLGKRGISPHAPYTVSPALLQNLIALAKQRQMPVAMHLAESAEELELLATGRGPFQELLDERSMWDPAAIPHGSRPLDYLQMLSEAPRSLVVHGNYLDREELKYLAAHADRMTLVYCPRTHAYFGHEPYPLEEALAVGVRVALGTDSRASNPDLSLLREMRAIARAHPNVSAEALLKMGTQAGAEALGWQAEMGSLTPGKEANFVVLPLPEKVLGTPAESLAQVLESNDSPIQTWLRGQEVRAG